MKTKKCSPILVENKEPSMNSLILIFNVLTRPTNQYELDQFTKNLNSKFYELFLISLEDDKVDVDDMFLYANSILKCTKVTEQGYTATTSDGSFAHAPKYCKKVIATRSQLSPGFISKFIEQYNSMGCVEDVEVEMELFWNNKKYKCQPFPDEYAAEKDRLYKPRLINGLVNIVEKSEPLLYPEEDLLNFAAWCGSTYVCCIEKDEERVWFDPRRSKYHKTSELLKIWIDLNKKN